MRLCTALALLLLPFILATAACCWNTGHVTPSPPSRIQPYCDARLCAARTTCSANETDAYSHATCREYWLCFHNPHVEQHFPLCPYKTLDHLYWACREQDAAGAWVRWTACVMHRSPPGWNGLYESDALTERKDGW